MDRQIKIKEKRTVNNLLIHILCFAMLAYASIKGSQPQIVSAKVFSLPFSVLIPYIDTTKSIVDRCKDYEQLMLTDSKLLSLIDHQLRLLPDTIAPNPNYDVRLVLLLTRETGSIDTLGFGYDGGYGPASMRLNSQFYPVDKELLREITVFLPSDHQPSIHEYLDIWLPDREKRRHEPHGEPDLK